MMKKIKQITTRTILGLVILLSLVNCSNDKIQETLTDSEGNVYKTIKIGKQVWMAENLRVTHYRDGSKIPKRALRSASYFIYDDKSSNIDTYGALYNWHAVNSKRKIAPEGWHVPTDVEWKELEMYLGMKQSEADGNKNSRGSNEGSKLAGNSALWEDGELKNNWGFGKSGFNALPGGGHTSIGIFREKGKEGNFWSATEINLKYAWFRKLSFDDTAIGRGGSTYKDNAFSVRLIKDPDSQIIGGTGNSEITTLHAGKMKQGEDNEVRNETDNSEFTSQSLDENEKDIDKGEVVYRDGKLYDSISDNLFSGTAVSYYQNGQKHKSAKYVEGQENGAFKEWYRNGRIEEVAEHMDGKYHGLRTKWYKTGQVESTYEYRDGKRHGTWKMWYGNGQMSATGEDRDGQDHGTYKRWHENGQQACIQELKDGVVHGVTKEWDEQGNLTEDVKYENGQLVE